jgi:hypothetical protein
MKGRRGKWGQTRDELSWRVVYLKAAANQIGGGEAGGFCGNGAV